MHIHYTGLYQCRRIPSDIKWKRRTLNVDVRKFILFSFSVGSCKKKKKKNPDHSLGLGFSIALLAIGFFLFLIAPTSSDLHHQVKLSQTEICEQANE